MGLVAKLNSDLQIRAEIVDSSFYDVLYVYYGDVLVYSVSRDGTIQCRALNEKQVHILKSAGIDVFSNNKGHFASVAHEYVYDFNEGINRKQ